MLNSITWNADPGIFDLGPLSIRWYGLLFASSFLVGFYLLQRMFRHEGVNKEWTDKAFIYVMIGTVIGARLGHVFFYDWGYYSQHPADIIKVWEGGLASHGAGVGILTALCLYSRYVSKKSILWILDRVVITVAIGGCFIRLGNLMNSEIYGIETTLPWGFIFVRDHQVVPRHPTQIYESLSYFIIFLLLIYYYWKTKAKEKQGFLFGFFLIFLFSARFLIEFVKENQSAFEASMLLNMGQLLSIPFILTGVYFVFRKNKDLRHEQC